MRLITPNNVEYIGEESFSNCWLLTNVKLSNTLRYIDLVVLELVSVYHRFKFQIVYKLLMNIVLLIVDH